MDFSLGPNQSLVLSVGRGTESFADLASNSIKVEISELLWFILGVLGPPKGEQTALGAMSRPRWVLISNWQSSPFTALPDTSYIDSCFINIIIFNLLCTLTFYHQFTGDETELGEFLKLLFPCLTSSFSKNKSLVFYSVSICHSVCLSS